MRQSLILLYDYRTVLKLCAISVVAFVLACFSARDKTVIIIGMHRSGTSMVASIVESLGVNLGTNLMPASRFNPIGYFEDYDFVRMNDQILKAARGSWNAPPSPDSIAEASSRFDQALSSLVASKQSSRVWGWKDPRTTITLGLYLKHLTRPLVIICHRNPRDVAVSLSLREGTDIDTSYRLIHAYDSAIAKLKRDYRNLRYLELDYDEVRRQPQRALLKLVRFIKVPVTYRQAAIAATLAMSTEKLEASKSQYVG